MSTGGRDDLLRVCGPVCAPRRGDATARTHTATATRAHTPRACGLQMWAGMGIWAIQARAARAGPAVHAFARALGRHRHTCLCPSDWFYSSRRSWARDSEMLRRHGLPRWGGFKARRRRPLHRRRTRIPGAGRPTGVSGARWSREARGECSKSRAAVHALRALWVGTGTASYPGQMSPTQATTVLSVSGCSWARVPESGVTWVPALAEASVCRRRPLHRRRTRIPRRR